MGDDATWSRELCSFTSSLGSLPSRNGRKKKCGARFRTFRQAAAALLVKIETGSAPDDMEEKLDSRSRLYGLGKKGFQVGETVIFATTIMCAMQSDKVRCTDNGCIPICGSMSEHATWRKSYISQYGRVQTPLSFLVKTDAMTDDRVAHVARMRFAIREVPLADGEKQR